MHRGTNCPDPRPRKRAVMKLITFAGRRQRTAYERSTSLNASILSNGRRRPWLTAIPLICALVMIVAAADGTMAQTAREPGPTARPDAPSQMKEECFGKSTGRRIEACTSLLAGALSRSERSLALAMRALAHSVRGDYERALPDYDRAIALRPNFPVALNNRAWANFKSGRYSAGLQDVESALALSPASPHALDTRAHLRQATGDVEGAMRDYRKAMRFGGGEMVRLYQCGLQAAGLYTGPLSGIVSRDLIGALESCARNRSCDPLPADEECRKLTS